MIETNIFFPEVRKMAKVTCPKLVNKNSDLFDYYVDVDFNSWLTKSS